MPEDTLATKPTLEPLCGILKDDNDIKKMKNQEEKSDEVYQTKKAMVMKDYDSLFNVYGRETNIVFLFRGWTITLLTGYYGFLMATNFNYSLLFVNLIPLFVIFMFLLLEVGERSVMLRLLEELRNLEELFMERSVGELKNKILHYEFRDMRDGKKISAKRKVKNYLKTFYRPQILSWYPLIVIFNFLILALILKNKELI